MAVVYGSVTISPEPASVFPFTPLSTEELTHVPVSLVFLIRLTLLSSNDGLAIPASLSTEIW